MKSNIIEGILIFIAIILIGFLIWNYGNYMDEKTILENEYEYNAVKLTNTQDTITTTMYRAIGNPAKYVDIYYLENGKIIKIVNEQYYKSINSAKQSYNWTINHSTGDDTEMYIKKNIITNVYNKPEITYDNPEETNFLTNQDFIKYAEEHMGETYPELIRVY